MRWSPFLAGAVLAFTAQIATARDRLVDLLALPVASGLVGARDVPLFAWVENAAGVRTIRTARPGQSPRAVTSWTDDDGVALYDLALSPDGTRIAFVRGGDDEFADAEDLPNAAAETITPRQQVYVATLGTPPVAIGDGHTPVFSPDGKRIAFTRRGELWLREPTGDARRIARVAGSIERLCWSPDGTMLAFLDDRDGRTFLALYTIGAARLRYVDAGLDHAAEPAFSPDGREIAFIRYTEPPAGAGADTGPYWSLRIADVASGATRVRWTAPRGPGARFAGTRGRNVFWSADGRIVFPSERSGWLHPQAVRATGSEPPRDLTPGAFEVESYTLTRDARALVYAANDRDLDRRALWQVALDGGAARRLTPSRTMAFAPTPGGDALAAIATDVTHVAHPVLVAGALPPLGAAPEATGFAAPETVRFRAADGFILSGQWFRARGPGRHPAVVYVHGGPRRQMLPGFHPSGYYSHAYIVNQQLAARGIDVLSVNYRGGTGFGLAFRDAPQTGREGASEYLDILAAGRWLAAQPTVDAGRIGVWGGSWGGYLTALALARDSDLFRVGVDFHGVHSLLRPVPDTMSPAAQAAVRAVQWQSSPMADIDRWRSPVLLIHGDDDRNVAVAQSLLLARELAARAIPYSAMAFPNERHAFLRHASWLTSLTATIAFLEAGLRPAIR